jgi:hypothetical protein
MRSTKCLVAATAVISALSTTSLAAHAGVYSVSQSIGGDAWALGVEVNTPAFDTALGKLIGMSLTVSGAETVYISGYLGEGSPLPPAEVGLHNTINLTGYGGNLASPFNEFYYPLENTTAQVTPDFGVGKSGFSPFPGGVYSIIGTVGVNKTFDLSESQLAYFAEPGSTGGGSLGLDSIDYTLSNGSHGIGGENSEGNFFSGTLTTTFTYRPMHVPEPGSLALLGTAAIMLAGVARLATRRKRGF